MGDDPEIHPLLEAQLEELGLEVETPPGPDQWREFVGRVDDGYNERRGEMLILDRNFDNMIRHAVDGFFIHDTRGGIIDCNQAACEMLGYSREELLSMSVADFELELDPGAIWDDMTVDEVFTVEGTHLRNDGTTYPVETRVGAFMVEGRKVILALCRDISERKEAERELKRLNRQLEQARDEAVRANRTKSAFLANMSHELRTPLNAVIGYSEFLIEEMEAAGDDHYLQDLERILTAGEHLLSLINDILDLSKIEAGKVDLDITEFELGEMLVDIESTARPLAEDNDNELVVETDVDDATMRTDVTKVRQILFNLLSNACKFTSEGTVRLGVDERDEQGLLEFEVEDTGIGMTDEEVAEVFSAFQQADASTTREYGGTGLGLAISKQYTDLLGGDIDVESTPGAGTVFTVVLPRDRRAWAGEHDQSDSAADEQPPQFEADAGLEQQPDGAKSTVVVIEDDPASRDLLSRTLREEGYRVVTAADGREGLELIEATDPAAVTLDLMMPNTSGWEVLKQLREDEAYRELPVILVSMLDERRRGLALGADEFLTKPVDRQRLVELLEKYQCADGDHSCLIVEDDEPTRALLAQIMEREGWNAVEAADGRQGLRVADRLEPDLVILDLMMPEVDGFEFLGEFRADDRFLDIPVVICTAKELTGDELERLERQANRVIEKSGWGPGALLAEVRRSLEEVDEAVSDR